MENMRQTEGNNWGLPDSLEHEYEVYRLPSGYRKTLINLVGEDGNYEFRNYKIVKGRVV